jgi:hypothetical protein
MVVNGEALGRENEPTGAWPGQLLRGLSARQWRKDYANDFTHLQRS